jgi:hypothetical protein
MEIETTLDYGFALGSLHSHNLDSRGHNHNPPYTIF